MRRSPEKGNFKDTLLDEVDYKDMPYSLLMHQSELGDERATAEMRRRAAEKVDAKIREIMARESESQGPLEATP